MSTTGALVDVCAWAVGRRPREAAMFVVGGIGAAEGSRGFGGSFLTGAAELDGPAARSLTSALSLPFALFRDFGEAGALELEDSSSDEAASSPK